MAQERKKRRIVLASVLKPVDDTRMFEKMGASLAPHGDEVYIIGYPSAVSTVPEGIQLLPLSPFKRLSFARLLAKWTVFGKLLKLKPAVVIFNTHELILPCVLLKIIMDVRIVYDVRENYYRNILHSGSFPFFIRWPLAWLVRFKEKLLAPAVDHF
ncbi:MAG TPA: glycosyltransferase, partial [Cyclobacteriaceae bacterium]|nr:glycosyltransferase [Cyclobacteriaceae bacterium]